MDRSPTAGTTTTTATPRAFSTTAHPAPPSASRRPGRTVSPRKDPCVSPLNLHAVLDQLRRAGIPVRDPSTAPSPEPAPPTLAPDPDPYPYPYPYPAEEEDDLVVKTEDDEDGESAAAHRRPRGKRRRQHPRRTRIALASPELEVGERSSTEEGDDDDDHPDIYDTPHHTRDDDAHGPVPSEQEEAPRADTPRHRDYDHAPSEEPNPALPIHPAILKKLDNPKRSREFTAARLQNNTEPDFLVRKGDVVALRPASSTADQPWVGRITAIKTLLEDLTPSLDEHGNPKYKKDGTQEMQGSLIYLKVDWLYTRRDFEDLHTDDWRLVQKVPCLGDHEYVETDHSQWEKQALIVTQTPERFVIILSLSENKGALNKAALRLLHFDDRYPLDAPPAAHPLSLTAPRSRAYHDLALPLYFFGDALRSDGDWAGVRWTRTAFDFELRPPAPVPKPPTPGKPEGAAATTGRTTTTRRRRRKTPRLTLEVKKPPWPSGKELKLNRHSISRTPYRPEQVQYYDHHSARWLSADDLARGCHYAHESRTVPRPPRFQVFDSDDDEPSARNRARVSSTSTASSSTTTTTSSSSSLSSSSSSSSSVAPVARDDSDSDGRRKLHRGVPAGLRSLARTAIVRGGAWGLTGNAYLVTRAAELCHSFHSGWTTTPPDLVDEGKELVRHAKEWRRQVRRRSRLGGFEEGLPPDGRVWVSPGTRMRI